MTYISGLNKLLDIKQQYPEIKTILHTDQGSVYASKAFNDLLPTYNIVRSMSRAGTPTDNGAMEAINVNFTPRATPARRFSYTLSHV